MLLQIEELEGNEEYQEALKKAQAKFEKEMENLDENDYESYKILYQEYVRKIEEAQIKALAKQAPDGIHEDFRKQFGKAQAKAKTKADAKAGGAPHLFSGMEGDQVEIVWVIGENQNDENWAIVQ